MNTNVARYNHLTFQVVILKSILNENFSNMNEMRKQTKKKGKLSVTENNKKNWL